MFLAALDNKFNATLPVGFDILAGDVLGSAVHDDVSLIEQTIKRTGNSHARLMHCVGMCLGGPIQPKSFAEGNPCSPVVSGIRDPG